MPPLQFQRSIGIWLAAIVTFSVMSSAQAGDEPRDDRYTPIRGGWQIRVHGPDHYQNIGGKQGGGSQTETRSLVHGVTAGRGCLPADAPIGSLVDNPRSHRRPLYPPADKSLIWTPEECAKTERVSFRPLVLAYHAPQFMFDFHSAGGVLGRLLVGLNRPGGPDKWLHQWSEIVVRYVDGRLEYDLRDEAFEGTTVRLTATALAEAAGLVLKIEVEGATRDTMLVWAYDAGCDSLLDTQQAPTLPEEAAKIKCTLEGGAFECVRPFNESDKAVGGNNKLLQLTRLLPGWTAHVKGGSSWQGTMGLGSPAALGSTPGELLAGTQWAATGQRLSQAHRVIVEKLALADGAASGYVVVGMGGNIATAIREPAGAYRAALARNESIAGRVVTRTPDPYLDAAMTTMAFATEGTWGSQAYDHGAWSWRDAYVGWRILYGPTCYGWTDRVRTSIRNQCRLGWIKDGPDKGAVSSMLEGVGFYYNMNEVFFDMIRHYFDYTGDLELMREIYPVLEGILERENRRLRPGPEYLYENALNTWISDSHWYIRGQCTQASAYMLDAYGFMANLAKQLGKDDAPFHEQARQIRADMQRLLWQKRRGVFAEYLDTRGNRLLHPEPELPSIYHSAEFGAADPLQVYQMLHWADTHLRQERTPGGGRFYWSSNWFPNHGRSYTHSTYEMAYGEELNFAETQFLGGRSEEGYALLRGAMSGIFNGPTPGGLSCHAYADGTQRMNEEFSDAISPWGRAVTEGLFGIRVKRSEGVVELIPQLPRDWREASIQTPHFSYQLRREGGAVRIEWESPVATRVRLRLPVEASSVDHVKASGSGLLHELRPGVGFTWLEATVPEAIKGTIEVSYTPDRARILEPASVKRGEVLNLSLPGVVISKWLDPQGLLSDVRIQDGRLVGKIECASGPGLLFVSQKGRICPRWIPVRINIEPEEPERQRVWSPPQLPDRDLKRWALIDLQKVYNVSVPEAPQRIRSGAIVPAMPADQVGFGYWLEHVANRAKPPSDAAWRAKIGEDGVAWTADGIPFKTPKDGPNIGLVCLNDRDFKPSLSFPVALQGRTLFLMISGTTHPNQSHVVNLRVVLRYADGTSESRDLVSPFDIGDCWNTWYGLFFDTPANGFENIGGRHGPAGSSQVQDRSRPVAVDTIAHLVAFPLRAGAVLEAIEMTAVANDVAFGVMGASVLK